MHITPATQASDVAELSNEVVSPLQEDQLLAFFPGLSVLPSISAPALVSLQSARSCLLPAALLPQDSIIALMRETRRTLASRLNRSEDMCGQAVDGMAKLAR